MKLILRNSKNENLRTNNIQSIIELKDTYSTRKRHTKYQVISKKERPRRQKERTDLQ